MDKAKKPKKGVGELNIVKKRIAIATIAVSVVIVALIFRVGWLQFVNGEELQRKALAQQSSGRVIPAKRGTIYDRNGNQLAISASCDQVSINPKQIKEYAEEEELDVAEYQRKIAQFLSSTLELDYNTVYEKVISNKAYQEIKRRIEKETGDTIRQWKSDNDISGVFVDEDTKRYYPNNNLAAHIIGFTGRDDQGLSGIEATYDEILKGKSGRVLTVVDAARKELPFSEERRVEPENGNNIVLTIDETIQYLVENALTKAISDCAVVGGAAAIVMDPSTGDILAMASKPDFDLNEPFAAPVGIDPTTWKGNTQEDIETLNKTVWRNKALQDTYEPGSTFKTITTCALLEEKVVTPTTVVQDSPVVFGKDSIKCWRSGGHGTETFEKAVHNSCNPVFSRFALQLGIPAYYNYIRAFGFYDKTGIELSGEAGSIFHKSPSEINLATTAFGQSFQITPIQLITAYCAVANGGTLLQPRLVKEITDQNGNIIESKEPTVVRKVLSKETCDTVKSILQGVVDVGTASNAYVKGYRVAGKTGTSQTIDPETGKYSKERYIVSFSAIAPSDDPEVCVLLLLDYPTITPVNLRSGGMTAAPAGGKLVEEILSYLQVERKYTEKDHVESTPTVVNPSVEGKTLAEAKQELTKQGLKVVVEGADEGTLVVTQQMPSSGTIIPKNTPVILYTSNDTEKKKSSVPNLKGMTISQAFNALSKKNLAIKIYGRGTCLTQSIEAGKEVEWGTVIEVDFREFDVE